MSQSSVPILTVSIVNTNNRDALYNCLASLFNTTRDTPMEVFVVDNASDDGSADMVRREFPQVRLMVNCERLGFPTNHNQVLRKGQGRFCLVLNEDVIILPGAVDSMVQHMNKYPKIGALGCRLLNPDGTWQRSIGIFPTLWSLTCDYLYLNKVFPQAAWVHTMHLITREPGEPAPVDYVIGACMLVRWETIEQVGLFDEELYAYNEDVDWCRRMWAAGWEVWYLPGSEVIHLGRLSRRQIRDLPAWRRDVWRIKASVGRYFAKYHGVVGLALYALLDLAGSLLGMIGSLIRPSDRCAFMLTKRKRAYASLTVSLRLLLRVVKLILLSHDILSFTYKEEH